MACHNFCNMLNVGLLNDKNIAFLLFDLYRLTTFELVTWLYMFDEAFEDDLLHHVVRLCVVGNAKFIISFKNSKHSSYHNIFQSFGYDKIHFIKVLKSGSGESNTAYLYKANMTENIKVCAQLFMNENPKEGILNQDTLYTDFIDPCFNISLQDKKDHYKKLTNTLFKKFQKNSFSNEQSFLADTFKLIN